MSTDIRKVKDTNGLIEYFAEKLDWNIDIDDFEDIDDIAYDFDAKDIGLKEEAFAKIDSLRQLPPLVDGQKWGIFCVEFDSRKFEVTALRKVLSGLIPNRRNSADHAVWNQQDLLFLCFWGEDNSRTIGIAHFEDKGSGLPQIKMISCAPAVEDFTQIQVFEDRLRKLEWPQNPENAELWRETWSSAFVSAHRQIVRDASTLTIQLALEAQEIRDRILSIFEIESTNGYVHLLFEKFRDTLIHDMTEEQFADMYAQTVVYGLFSARCMDETQEDFSAEEAVTCIPNTNPFLKSLLEECLGSQQNSKLSFDELEINDVVELLRETRTDEIIKDFNRQTGGGKEDPVIHFYEEFLTAYDKTQKVQRGVYYTPQPVVNFIVRAVDSIIKHEFGLEEGLASTAKKTINIKRKSKKKINGYYKEVDDTEDVPAIQVLDPATGTGTFIRQVILQVYDNFKQANKTLSDTELKAAWNKYVPEHLLPRINAFELMMAPYAVTHMKLAMVLRDTGYEFGGNKRLNIYLTNSLEEPGNSEAQIRLWDDPLATESVFANAVKKNAGINVVLGNPPYSGVSSNNNKWITKLIDDYKYENGEYFNERKHWLNDDYVKFIRYAQLLTDKTKKGITAYICPHGYIDNPTFRAMRWNLMQTYKKVYILNLHGNINRKETCPDGTKDENVFDIQQGVAISILIHDIDAKDETRVYYADLYGLRNEKYCFLTKTTLDEIEWKELRPDKPFYLFRPEDNSNALEYNDGFRITDLFNAYTSGIITSRDALAIDFSRDGLLRKINLFTDYSVDEMTIRKTFFGESKAKGRLPGDSSVWSLTKGREAIKDNYHQDYIRPITYRPFDIRYIYYSSAIIHRTREDVIGNLYPPNIGIITARSNKSGKCDHFYVTENVAEAKCGESTTQSAIFPLYVYGEDALFKHPNLSKDIVSEISRKTQLLYDENKKTGGVENGQFGPRDLIYYIYAIMNSNKYRTKYKEQLSMDYPVIPYPCNEAIFSSMVVLGERICDIHLMKSPDYVETGFSDNGLNIVEFYKYKDNEVFINNSQSFSNINADEWNYSIGGYQPLQKWLKDRKGKELNNSDIECYERIVAAIRNSMILMTQIDNVIDPLLG